MITTRTSNPSSLTKSCEDSILAKQMGDLGLDIKLREAACSELGLRYQNSVVATLTKRFKDPVLALESWNQSMIKFWNAEVIIKNAGSAFNLIFTIAVNHGTSQLRKINCRVPLNQGDKGLENIKDSREPFQDLEFADDNITKLREALRHLKPKQREILEAVYLKELKYRECAEMLEIPIGTVMGTIAKAKQILKDKIAA